MSHDKTDLKALAKELSDSYSAILQYSSLKDEQIVDHLERLAKYSDHLPLTWFSPALIESLLALRRRDNERETNAIHTLWTVWLRRLSGAPDAIPNVEPQLLKVLSEQQNVIMRPDTSISVRKDAWIGLLALAGCGTAKFSDVELVGTITRAIEEYSKDIELVHQMNDTIDACVAHFLAQTTLLNAFEVEHCQKLLDAYLHMKATQSQAVPGIMTVMEHVVDIRSKQKPTSRADADLETTVKMAEFLVADSIQPEKLAVLAGILRMLQFVQVKSKRVRSLRRQAETLFVNKLNELVTHVLVPEHASSMATLQDAIAYMAGQCIPNSPADILETVNANNFLRVLISCLLTSQQIWGNGQIFYNLDNTPASKQKLDKLLNAPLHKEIGRVSRAIGTVIKNGLETRSDDNFVTTLQASLDRLVGFSHNVYIDWDRFHRDNNETTMSQELKKQFKEVTDAAWSVLKSMLFAYTAIFKAMAVDLPNGKGLVEVEYAAQDIVSCFANFHFITDRLGSGSGFTAYQETLTNAVAYLLHDENVCQLNQMLSKVYREYAPLHYTSDATPPVALLSPIQQTRLLFYTNLVEQVIGHLDDKVLEADILPAIYPVLKWKKNESKDLYESAHAAILAIFASQKPISRELTGIYANILLESFPEPMTLQQLRFAFTTTIQSICQLDDALAWLATEFLLDKIRSSSSDDVKVSQYLTVLIDLIKPLSLGPFFGQLLSNIENLVLQQPTSAMRTASLKIVFETVSSSAVSDLRRVEAVGWFLNLKQKVEALSKNSTMASA